MPCHGAKRGSHTAGLAVGVMLSASRRPPGRRAAGRNRRRGRRRPHGSSCGLPPGALIPEPDDHTGLALTPAAVSVPVGVLGRQGVPVLAVRRARLPVVRSALHVPVCRVAGVRAEAQVRRVHARRVVAVMADRRPSGIDPCASIQATRWAYWTRATDREARRAPATSARRRGPARRAVAHRRRGAETPMCLGGAGRSVRDRVTSARRRGPA